MNELQSQVRYLRDTKGLSMRQVAQELKVSRAKISRLCSKSAESRQILPKKHLLAPYRDLIIAWIKETPSLKGVQIWKRLLGRGITVAERTVSEYTQDFRAKKNPKTFWPLTFLPGEEAQVDWFFLKHPIIGRLCGFTLILSHSRFAFAHFFPRCGFEFFIAGHLMAFKAIGGTPRALRFDNLKSVVIKRVPLTYNAAFLEFANYYGFDIRLCNPASGNEKGRVERLIRSIRDTFENTAGNHQSLSALNQALHEWIREKNDTIHRATNTMPKVKRLEETLKSLPDNPYPNVVIHAGKSPSKTGLVTFDTNDYSIPSYCRNATIAVHAGIESLDFIDGKGKKVATHPRCFQKRQRIINPLHRSVSNLSERAKRERIHAVMSLMSPDIGKFLKQNADVGEDPCSTAIVLFRLLKTQSRTIVESIARDAVRLRSPRLKFVLSSLKLPQPEPVEIVSPRNQELLSLDYTPRSLEEYDDDTDEKQKH